MARCLHLIYFAYIKHMKLYTLFAAYLLVVTRVIAANHDSLSKIYSPFRHEISLSIGHWSTDMMTVGWGDMHRTVSIAKYSGAFAGTYKLRLGPRVFLGLGLGYEHESGDLLKIRLVGRTSFTADTFGTYKMSVITAVPDITYIYAYNPERASIFYGTIGAGISYARQATETDSAFNDFNSYPRGMPFFLLNSNQRVHFNGQISPLCFKVGYNRFSGFVELGFGYKGIACLGATWKY